MNEALNRLAARLRRRIKRIVESPLEQMCYRDVVERSTQPDGEHLKLSCGHRVLLVVRHRASFPCEECAAIKLLEGGGK